NPRFTPGSAGAITPPIPGSFTPPRDTGLLEKFRKEALGAALLAVYGVWQAEGKVRHLIASKLVDRSELLGSLPTTAREFC
ncbi:hypothetical protein, partial [Burkholderia multivorans]|uniref:hypothetical protein n=1 Tax=Burkholderia multivorans TaxID=87883 RepID=UPI0021596540